MPDQTYRIIYEGVPDKANRGIDALIAKLTKLEAAVDKVGAKFRTFGADTPNIPKLEAALKAIDAELKSKIIDAGNAEKALRGIGRGNSAVASLTKGLAALDAQLGKTTATAAAATPALAGVGSGSTIGPRAGGNAGSGRVGPGGIITAGLGRHLAYATFRSAIGAAGQGVADRREHFAENAQMAGEYRKDLKELAVLQGKTEADDSTIREDLAFQKKTLLNPEDSRAFRLEFGGAVAASLDARDKAGNPNITAKTAKELEIEAGRFTARYGLDPTTGGRMAGLLGVTEKVPDAKTGMRIMAEAMEQLNVKGVGPVKNLAKHMFALSGGMLAPDEGEVDDEGNPVREGGRFPSFPAMAARFAATTISTVGGADVAKTKIRAVDRMMRKNTDGMAEFRKKIGVTPDMDFEQMLRKFEPEVLKPDGDDILKEHGYKNSYERTAIIEAAKLRKQVDANLADPQIKARAAMASADSESYARSVAGGQQRAENEEYAARVESGMAGERLRAARGSERGKMIRSDTLKAGAVGAWGDWLLKGATLGGISGEDQRVDSAVINSLQERGQRAGVDVLGSHPQLDLGPRLANFSDEKMLASEFDAASREVEAAEAAQQAAAALKKLGNALGKGGRQGPPPPPGNGGAGFNPGRP